MPDSYPAEGSAALSFILTNQHKNLIREQTRQYEEMRRQRQKARIEHALVADKKTMSMAEQLRAHRRDFLNQLSVGVSGSAQPVSRKSSRAEADSPAVYESHEIAQARTRGSVAVTKTRKISEQLSNMNVLALSEDTQQPTKAAKPVSVAPKKHHARKS